MNKLFKRLDVSEFSDAAIENMLVAGKLEPKAFKELMETHEATKAFKEQAELAIRAVSIVVHKLEQRDYNQYGPLSPSDMAHGIRHAMAGLGVTIV